VSKRQEREWFQRVAEMMVRDDCGLSTACTRLSIPITSVECDSVYKSKEFQRILRTQRIKFYNELANDPTRTKRTAIGILLHAMEKLVESGAYDKVPNSVFQLARIEGWVGPEGNVNVFAGLTASELAQVRRKVAGTEEELPLGKPN
jgi:hypothetical protein